MSLNKFEYSRLLHDLKRAGKVIDIIVDENNQERRKLIADLLRAEFDKFFEDLGDINKNLFANEKDNP